MLITVKSRNSPLRLLGKTRLELCVPVIASRLVEFILVRKMCLFLSIIVLGQIKSSFDLIPFLSVVHSVSGLFIS